MAKANLEGKTSSPPVVCVSPSDEPTKKVSSDGQPEDSRKSKDNSEETKQSEESEQSGMTDTAV